jgi:hypothetical protein
LLTAIIERTILQKSYFDLSFLSNIPNPGHAVGLRSARARPMQCPLSISLFSIPTIAVFSHSLFLSVEGFSLSIEKLDISNAFLFNPCVFLQISAGFRVARSVSLDCPRIFTDDLKDGVVPLSRAVPEHAAQVFLLIGFDSPFPDQRSNGPLAGDRRFVYRERQI